MADIVPIKKLESPATNDILARLEQIEDSFLTALQEIRAVRLELKTQVDSMPSLEKLLDTAEVAELLGETEQWVYRQAKTKKLPSIKLGKYWKFSPVQLQKWLEKKQTS